MIIFENLNFQSTSFSKNVPFFVGSVHKFGKSDDDIISEKVLLSNIWICGFMPNLYNKSWMVSRAAASATKMSRWNELYSGWSLCSGSTLLRTLAVWIREFAVIRNWRNFPSNPKLGQSIISIGELIYTCKVVFAG